MSTRITHKAARPDVRTRLMTYGIHHLRDFISSLGRLVATPASSIMTITVIAIALALPTGFFLLLQNLQQLSGRWDGAARISVYLQTSATQQQIDNLSQTFSQRSDVLDVEVITQAEALESFKTASGFGDALTALPENPLPATLVVTPTDTASEAVTQLDNMLRAFSQQPLVDSAKLDLEWVKRLYSIISLVERGITIIAMMLAAAVILTIGNTIRLDIQNRQTEIRVQKLIGATNAFVRRPFLYTGLWYGLIGGVLSWLLLLVATGFIQGPTQRLIGLYNSQFELTTLNLQVTGWLMLAAITLGLLGSWLAVGKHLQHIEPGH